MDVERYLAALEKSDTGGVLALFAPGGIVRSPLYGELPATEFYPLLFADTAESRLSLRCVLTGQRCGRDIIAFWFDFDWTLADGTPAPFTVVDLAELDSDGRIAALDIVYDTAPIRGAFEKLRD